MPPQAKRLALHPARSNRVKGLTCPLHIQPAVALICLLFIVGCTGCSALRLRQMQRHAARGDDAWIAAQTIDCETPSPTCSQLHRLKGASCLRLAESGKDPAGYFACAADALATAIDLTPSGENGGQPLDLHEQYCEALDGLQGSQTGPTAQKTRQRLLQAAQTLYRLAPDSIPATYYLSIARLRELEPRLTAITAADRLPVCSRLKRTVNRVLSRMETAQYDRPPDWQRFAERYQRLAFDLGSALHAADCR